MRQQSRRDCGDEAEAEDRGRNTEGEEIEKERTHRVEVVIVSPV
jgi:hypothetical protein